MDNIRSFLENELDSNDNVVAVGDGVDGNPVVFVLDDTPDAVASCINVSPKITVVKVGGFGVGPPYWNDIANPLTYKNRMRPVPGGVSVGNWRITAGTVSCYVNDNVSGDRVLLSNWHVLSGDSGLIGDDIIQPGSADGGTRPNDVVASLYRRVPVHTDLTVFVDCAVARMKNQSDIDENVIALGKPHGMIAPHLGQYLKKSGRTSETTAGRVEVINASVKVNYGNFTKTLQDCVLTSVPSSPGDSGSLMMDYGNKAVALLFAGGTTAGGYLITIGCRADRVESELNVKFSMPDQIQKRNGIDVSKWQGEMNWQVAKDAGIGVAIIRAGSIDNVTGVPYKDTQFQRNAEMAPLLMPVGFYWYFRPNWSSKVQADFFCDLIKDVDWKVPPIIDMEENAAMDNSSVAAAVWSFANQIEQKLGVRPIIYTSPGFWNSYVGPTSWAKNYPLWVANWVNVGGLYPSIPTDWKGITPVMWQYRVFSGGGSLYGAQSPDIDLDVTYPKFEDLLIGSTPPPNKATLTVSISGQGYVSPSSGEYDLGTEVQLTANPNTGWVFSGWSGDITGTSNPITVIMDANKLITATFVSSGGTTPKEFIINKGITQVDGLRYRVAPGTNQTISGSMPKGTTVEIMETKTLGSDVWVRIGWKQWSAMKFGGQEFIKYIF